MASTGGVGTVVPSLRAFAGSSVRADRRTARRGAGSRTNLLRGPVVPHGTSERGSVTARRCLGCAAWSRVPTAVLAGLTLVVGFAVAQATGVRALGGAVLLAGVAWCVVRARSAGWWRLTLVVLTGLVCFVASHLLAPHLGAWPSVVLVALVLAAVTYALVDRPRPGRWPRRPESVADVGQDGPMTPPRLLRARDARRRPGGRPRPRPEREARRAGPDRDVRRVRPRTRRRPPWRSGCRTVLVTALGDGAGRATWCATGCAPPGSRSSTCSRASPGRPPSRRVLVTRSTGERAVVSVNATARRGPGRDAVGGGRRRRVRRPCSSTGTTSRRRRGARPRRARARPARRRQLEARVWSGCSRTSTTPSSRATSRCPGGPLDGATSWTRRRPRAADRRALGRRRPGPGPGQRAARRAVRGGCRRTSRPSDVVDTLGAGDVLHGAIAASLARGRRDRRRDPRRGAAGVRVGPPPGALGWVGR